jgi:hypothetical protein
MMQLVLDCVPVECEQPNPRTLVLHSEYYAAKLVVNPRFVDKCVGFNYWHDESDSQFVYVDANEHAGRITFSSLSRPVTLDMVASWWDSNFDAINEIGYEVLERVPV